MEPSPHQYLGHDMGPQADVLGPGEPVDEFADSDPVVETADAFEIVPADQHRRCRRSFHRIAVRAQARSCGRAQIRADEFLDQTEDHVSIPALHRLDLPFQFGGHPEVVAVEKGDQAALRKAGAMIACRGGAAALLPVVAKTRVVEAGCDFAGGIHRSIVDHDYFRHLARLRLDAGERRRQIVGAVEHRYHHADAAPLRLRNTLESQVNRFRVNEPNVVFEAFDEEIVLVNLETGNYYSARGSGPEIWLAVARGQTAEEIAEGLSHRYGEDAGALREAVDPFIASLQAAELIVETEDGADQMRTPAPALAGAEPSAFSPPVLEAYADMQDLLMLDPIHDVDAAGWPVANPN